MDVYEQNVEQIKHNFLNKNNDNYDIRNQNREDNKFKND
jgi:hypothetical protein